MKHKKLLSDVFKSNNKLYAILLKYDHAQSCEIQIKGQIENNNQAIKLLNQ